MSSSLRIQCLEKHLNTDTNSLKAIPRNRVWSDPSLLDWLQTRFHPSRLPLSSGTCSSSAPAAHRRRSGSFCGTGCSIGDRNDPRFRSFPLYLLARIFGGEINHRGPRRHTCYSFRSDTAFPLRSDYLSFIELSPGAQRLTDKLAARLLKALKI